MEPLAVLGALAVVIGIIGVIVLFKGKKKPPVRQSRDHRALLRCE